MVKKIKISAISVTKGKYLECDITQEIYIESQLNKV